MQETAREISVFCKLSREIKRESMKVNDFYILQNLKAEVAKVVLIQEQTRQTFVKLLTYLLE